jgi:hypothetical protein
MNIFRAHKGLESLTAVVISWVVTPRSPFRMSRRLGIASYPLGLLKRWLIVNGLQGVMYQKIQIFVFRVYLKVI